MCLHVGDHGSVFYLYCIVWQEYARLFPAHGYFPRDIEADGQQMLLIRYRKKDRNRPVNFIDHAGHRYSFVAEESAVQAFRSKRQTSDLMHMLRLAYAQLEPCPNNAGIHNREHLVSYLSLIHI